MNTHWPLDLRCYYLNTGRRLAFVLPSIRRYHDKITIEIMTDRILFCMDGYTRKLSEDENIDPYLCRCSYDHNINKRVYTPLNVNPIEKTIRILPMPIADEILCEFRLSICAALKLL